jgi:hypothetical protein
MSSLLYRLSSISIVLALTGTAVASTPLCSGGFEVGLEPRTFDGEHFDVVRLTSPIVTLSAYTFGPWIPEATGANAPGLLLRHRGVRSVSFQVAPVDASRNPATVVDWEAYLTTVQAGLGKEATLGFVADSSADNKIVQLLGWTTREATFVVPQPEGREPYVEQHIVVSGERAGVAFVLSGPQSSLESVRRDFRFFLSRLERKASTNKPPGRIMADGGEQPSADRS